MLPSTWKTPKAAVALIRASRKDATDKMLGFLFTGWSEGGSGEYLLAALKGEGPPAGVNEKRFQAAQQLADTIRAGLAELDAQATQ